MDCSDLYFHSQIKNWEKIIDSLLKNKDDNNQILIEGLHKDEYLNEIKLMKRKINELTDQRREKKRMNLSIKKCTTFQKNKIEIYRNDNGRKYDNLTTLMDSKFLFLK